MKYILKNKEEVESIPIGRAKIHIGDKQKDGKLTICDRGPNKNNSKARVICLCECGNYTLIDAQSFYNATTKSCGCYNIELRKKLGKILGKKGKKSKDYTKISNPFYSFIKQLDKKDNNNSYIWIIECNNCGKKYEAVPSQLISETRRRGYNPCDCWKKISKGVYLIKTLLEKNNIDYIQEYSFSDCLSPQNNKLKFDFYLPTYNILIEYDGEQHFFPTSFGGKKDGEIRLKENQEYDNIKDQYCQLKNIPLIRISYKDYSNLNINILLGESK